MKTINIIAYKEFGRWWYAPKYGNDLTFSEMDSDIETEEDVVRYLNWLFVCDNNGCGRFDKLNVEFV